MGVLAFVRKHLADAGYSPTAPLVPASLNGHKLADSLTSGGASVDYWFQGYLDSEATNEALMNDGRKLINAPSRNALLVSSSPIALTGSLTPFNKKCILRAFHADIQGAVIVVTAAGRISTLTGSPGDIAIALSIGGGAIANIATNGGLPSALSSCVWSLQAVCAVRAPGTVGSIWPGAVFYTMPAPVLAFACPGLASFNLQIDHDVEAHVDWATGDAANSIILDHFDLDVKPTGELRT